MCLTTDVEFSIKNTKNLRKERKNSCSSSTTGTKANKKFTTWHNCAV